jgi:hypothetical protein
MIETPIPADVKQKDFPVPLSMLNPRLAEYPMPVPF